MTYTAATLATIVLFLTSPSQAARQIVTSIVMDIQRADYEGDRAALERLHAQLTPFLGDRELASRILYWRGYALWRRALNGFNDAAERKEIEEDLTQCAMEFRQAWREIPRSWMPRSARHRAS